MYIFMQMLMPKRQHASCKDVFKIIFTCTYSGSSVSKSELPPSFIHGWLDSVDKQVISKLQNSLQEAGCVSMPVCMSDNECTPHFSTHLLMCPSIHPTTSPSLSPPSSPVIHTVICLQMARAPSLCFVTPIPATQWLTLTLIYFYPTIISQNMLNKWHSVTWRWGKSH